MIMGLTIKIGTDIFMAGGTSMSIIATIVVGSDGSTTRNGSSTEITSPTDRATFLARRRQVDAIIIGGNTARNEPYSKTPVPLIVVSHQKHPDLSAAHVWSIDPVDALEKARQQFGQNILIEGGSAFISYLLKKNVIDVLELSVTPAIGGSDFFAYKEFLALAKNVTEKTIADTIFYTAEFTTQK